MPLLAAAYRPQATGRRPQAWYALIRSTKPVACGLWLVALLTTSCSSDTVPKPRGYPRLDLPDTAFTAYTGLCPFAADIPAYAVALDKPGLTQAIADTTCYTTLRFPGQRGSVFMTYRRIAEDLPELISDAHAFKSKHEAKAARIRSERIMRTDAGVYGNLFAVDGEVASPLVFYLTDSTRHFLYGSLYFDTPPNADSLAPVTERLRADLQRFANTLRWR